MPQDEDFPPEDPDDVDPNHFEFFGFGQPGHGPPPPPAGNGPNAQDIFHADAANPAWAPQPNPHAAQPNGDVPLLIPIQQEEQIDGVANADVNAVLLPVEEVIQNAPEEEEPPQLPEEQVLAMDVDTDTNSEGFQPVQLPIPEVEIVPFPDFNNLQPLMPEEFPEEELLGWINGNGNDNGQDSGDDQNNNEEEQNNNEDVPQPPEQFNGNIQIGLVQIQDTWPQKEVPISFSQMWENKLAWSGFEAGQSSKSSLPLDPSVAGVGEASLSNSTTFVPSQNIPNPTTVRMWAKFFASRDRPTVTIPAEWMDFFTMLLLKESSNEWATQFLKSQAWSQVSDSSNGNCYAFSLPRTRPSVTITKLCCSEHVEAYAGISKEFQTVVDQSPALETQDTSQPMEQDSTHPFGKQAQDADDAHLPSISSPIKRGIKRGKAVIISDSQLRCSSRLHSIHKGFKPSHCKQKSCLGCDAKPPLISSNVVRDLGERFCKVDQKCLTEERLLSKPAAKKPVGRPKKAKVDDN